MRISDWSSDVCSSDLASTVDASLGGLGGCPFAPGAAGNVATEDAIYMLEKSGVATGVDLSKVVEAADWLTTVMGRLLPALVRKAPAFPSDSVHSYDPFALRLSTGLSFF